MVGSLLCDFAFPSLCFARVCIDRQDIFSSTPVYGKSSVQPTVPPEFPSPLPTRASVIEWLLTLNASYRTFAMSRVKNLALSVHGDSSPIQVAIERTKTQSFEKQ
ncbi:uncharacterized protein BDZ83DRAFT_653498 [Colletotrichum acutatum]|uniref:Uncharacterized protein n=1 Tax=Glomerella acutata TaxID=27357 RepID=A0AAD8UEW8_GLOAC|nr:uncharacterized protein BDZ83DRAFT_653498 [Colletotrichum acutatum]KAK1722942.1 hypothetical protein BDZ83DRAFT_653498 [Colletotrichum acutatum]